MSGEILDRAMLPDDDEGPRVGCDRNMLGFRHRRRRAGEGATSRRRQSSGPVAHADERLLALGVEVGATDPDADFFKCSKMKGGYASPMPSPTYAVERFATFEATFPDDSVEDREGNVTVPAGRNILSAVSDRLGEIGFTPTTPEQHRFRGRSFELAIDGLRARRQHPYPSPQAPASSWRRDGGARATLDDRDRLR